VWAISFGKVVEFERLLELALIHRDPGNDRTVIADEFRV
jgi:hypothetical protein